MKKKLIILISLGIVLIISGCSDHSKDSTTKSSTNITMASGSEVSSEKEAFSTNDSIDDSSIDDVRKENPTDDVSQLRRQLYEAGINSSTISDSELEQYKKEADEKEIEFSTYISDIVH